MEQFVQNAQSILDKAAREWNDLRVKALSALEQADQDQLLFRDLALAKEQQRLQEHIARWNRDLEDLRKRDPEGLPIDGEKLLDRIQLVLDIAGFIPVLGAGPDAINTIISVGRGNWGDAAINAIAIIPFWGDAAKGGKMLAKAGREGVSHVDEVAGVVSSAVRHYGDDAVSAIPESRRWVGKNWLDNVRKKVKVQIVENLGQTAHYDELKNLIRVDAAKWLQMNNAQRVTVIFHELWHRKEGFTKLFPKLENWVVKNTALGKFFSEGMAQFYGSWKVWPSLMKGWDYVDKTAGLTKIGLIFEGTSAVGSVGGIVVGLYWEYAELFDEE